MRTEAEMFKLLTGFAENDERIRVMGMEGSRTNANVPRDDFQDYDISYIVTDMESFILDDAWLGVFGKRVMMQKPEAMELFPPSNEWFSYLMIFEDGVKIDLSIIPLGLLPKYLGSDKLIKILIDKDGLIPDPPVPTDEDYHIKRPSAASFDDCCNEFWFVSTYVAKGLFRGELLFAAYHMEHIAREQLLTMLSWMIGNCRGFGLSLGKNYKYIDKYLSKRHWELLLKTCRMDGVENCWAALDAAFELFREISRSVADDLGFVYPDYDERVTEYIETNRRRLIL